MQARAPAHRGQPRRASAFAASRRSSASIPTAADGGGPQLFFAEFECYVDLNPQPGRRPHVPLRGGHQRGDRRSVLAESLKAEHPPPGSPSASATARAGCAPRSRCRPLPRDGPSPSAASRRRRSTRPPAPRSLGRRHAHLDRRPGPGHDRLPCAQELIASGARERLPKPATARTSRARSSSSSPSPPTTSAASAPSTSAAPRTADRDRRPRAARIVESSMSSEIYEPMKREDERSVAEKAHANPRFVEDCVREMVRQLAHRPSRPQRPQLHPRPVRRTSRRSIATTWWPSAPGSCRRSSPSSPPATTPPGT